jgi:hypothetical protein
MAPTVALAVAAVYALVASARPALGSVSRMVENGCHLPSPAFAWRFPLAEGAMPQSRYDHSVHDVESVVGRALSQSSEGGAFVVIRHGLSTSDVAHASNSRNLGSLSTAHEASPYVYASDGGLMGVFAEKGKQVRVVEATERIGDAIPAAAGDSVILSLELPMGNTAEDLDALLSQLLPVIEGMDSTLLVVGEGARDVSSGCGRRRLLAEGQYQRTLQSTDMARTIKMTPDILAGLLFFFLFLFIALTGLSCLNGIDSDLEAFVAEDDKPASGREY